VLPVPVSRNGAVDWSIAASDSGFEAVSAQVYLSLGGGSTVTIPVFRLAPRGFRLPLAGWNESWGTVSIIRDGTEIPKPRWTELEPGNYRLAFSRPDHSSLYRDVPLENDSGLLDITPPDDTAWQPNQALRTLQEARAAFESNNAVLLRELTPRLEALPLEDPRHQAELQSLRARLAEMNSDDWDRVVEIEMRKVREFRPWLYQVGVFAGLNVVLRSDDRRMDTRPFVRIQPPSIPAGHKAAPYARYLEIWANLAAGEAGRAERDAAASALSSLATELGASSQPQLAAACLLDAESLKARRRRPPAEGLVKSDAGLARVRAHVMFAGPEGLGGGVGPRETLEDISTYLASARDYTTYDVLLAVYAAWYAFKPHIEEPEENRIKFKDDPDYQRNTEILRRENEALARLLLKGIADVQIEDAETWRRVFENDRVPAAWMNVAFARMLPPEHAMRIAGEAWLRSNPMPVDRMKLILEYIGIPSN